MESFEKSLEELDKILHELEKGELSLQDSINKFKKGIELINYCKKELEEAELSIKKVVDGEEVKFDEKKESKEGDNKIN